MDFLHAIFFYMPSISTTSFVSFLLSPLQFILWYLCNPILDLLIQFNLSYIGKGSLCKEFAKGCDTRSAKEAI